MTPDTMFDKLMRALIIILGILIGHLIASRLF
jgi:hypothetical protein